MKLRVLLVITDDGVARAIESVARDEGDDVERAEDIEAAVGSAATLAVDVAFIELAAEGGAAMALCHHLPSTSPGVRVHAVVAPADLERGAEAMSLGAESVVIAPVSGDAILRILTDAKAEIARADRLAALERKLAIEKRRVETYDRLVRFARGATQSDAVKAIVDGVAQISGARGVALYATFGGDEAERVRLAAVGSAVDLPANALAADLSHMASAKHARVVPLVANAGEVGILILDAAPDATDAELSAFADLAAAMLTFLDRQDPVDENLRVFAPKQFEVVASRMLTLAARHDRRSSVIAISLPNGERRGEEVTVEIADIVRSTDALSGTEDGDLLLFLPETGGLGAHACRRRILARLSGDRRGRPKSGPQGRAKEPRSKAVAVAVGVATFPHDGASLKRLVRAARTRAVDDGRSPVHALALDGLSLPEMVDALIARPMIDAGPRSAYPLDVANASLFSLVTRAYREALRGGEANVLTTLQPGLGVAAAARQIGAPRVLDVRAQPGCEDIEAIVVEAEHASWVCCGRILGERFRGVHAADPLLCDLLARRLSSMGGTHAG